EEKTMMIDAHEQRVLVPVYMQSGIDTYAGRMDAWHALGNVTGKFETLEAITMAAGANFPVVKLQLEYDGFLVPAWGTFRVDQLPVKGLERQQIVRQDGRYTFLAPVGEGY